MAGGDVQETKFVGTGRVINDRLFDRIAGVAQLFEIDALDHAAVFDVQARNDADFQHQRVRARAAMFIKARPQTACAGIAVVRLKASASSNMSRASANFPSFQRFACALKDCSRRKCTGGRSFFIATSRLSPRPLFSLTKVSRWKCPIAPRSTWLTEI